MARDDSKKTKKADDARGDELDEAEQREAEQRETGTRAGPWGASHRAGPVGGRLRGGLPDLPGVSTRAGL